LDLINWAKNRREKEKQTRKKDGDGSGENKRCRLRGTQSGSEEQPHGGDEKGYREISDSKGGKKLENETGKGGVTEGQGGCMQSPNMNFSLKTRVSRNSRGSADEGGVSRGTKKKRGRG